MLESLNCRLCGGELQPKDGGTYICACCGGAFVRKAEDDYAEKLKDVLKEEKYERVSAARRNLWGAMHEENVSSEVCTAYAKELKLLVPEDYYANFAETANGKGDAEISAFLNSSSQKDMETYADAVLNFMIKSMTPGTLAAVCGYIDRAFPDKNTKAYDDCLNLYESEAEKVNSGLYEPSIPRDVFIAYSSEDMPKVLELCEFLEEQDVTCFLALRNLRHGRGARENYDKAIKKAMDNCRIILYVSSNNSRKIGCDAYKTEIPYIRGKDIGRAPAEIAKGDYKKIPVKYKKDRIEYLLDDYTGAPTDRTVKEFFAGYEWCRTLDTVADRVISYLTSEPEVDEHPSAPDEERIASFEKRKEEGINSVKRFLGGGVFDDAAEILNDLEKEEKELFGGNPSAEICYYKILVDYEARNENELVDKVASSGTDIRRNVNYKHAVAAQDGPERDRLLEIAEKILSAASSRTQSDAGEKNEDIERKKREEAGDQYFTAENYYYGRGVRQNFEEAVRWYRKSAERGNSDAEFGLGRCYDYGQGVKQDIAEAVKWYMLSAEHGNVKGQNVIGFLYEYGSGVKQDFAEAVKWYRKSAEQGNARGQNFLGHCYHKGIGVDQDINEAMKWFRMSATQNDPVAQCNIGYCYEHGEGVEQDFSKAVKWYRKSAEQGNAEAQNYLGQCYEKGRGIKRNIYIAHNWYDKSANNGNVCGAINLGRCYEKGIGTQKNYANALSWYKWAAEKGNAEAQNKVGDCYRRRIGTTRNYAEAAKWYKLSAEQGNADAQQNFSKLPRKWRK